MEILISVSGVKNTVHPWAKAMLIASPALQKCSLSDLMSQDGCLIGKGKARQALKELASYKPFEQVDDFWVIESPNDSNEGLTIDFREEMTDSPSQAIVQFYREA